MDDNNNRYFILVAVGVICWGSANPAMRYLTQTGMDPYLVAFLRVACAICFLWLAMAARRDLPRLHVLSRNLCPLILMGLTGVTAFLGLTCLGLQHTEAGKAALINAINPVFIILMAHVLLKDSVRLCQIIGCLVALVGVFFSIIGGNVFSPGGMNFQVWDLLYLVTALCWASYTILNRVFNNHIPYFQSLFFTMLCALIIYLPFMTNKFSALASITQRQWFLVIYCGLFPGCVGYFCWSVGLKKIGAANCGMLNTLLPVSSVIISSIWLGESLNWLQLLGGAAVIGGVLVGINRRRDKPYDG